MSRRARNQTTVSLFPFLAVLLCAMGALLVLLVITTRQIRDDAIRQVAAKPQESIAPQPAETVPDPAYEWPVWEIVLGEARELDRRSLPTPPPPALLAPKPVYVKRDTDPPPPDLTAELQQLHRQIQRANTQLADHRKSASKLQNSRAAMLAEIEKRENVLKNADQAIAGFQSEGQQLSHQLSALDPTQKLVSAAESGYREGARTLVELLDAYRAQTDVDGRRLELAATAKHAEIALRYARGEFE
jgi:hypothetical protein